MHADAEARQALVLCPQGVEGDVALAKFQSGPPQSNLLEEAQVVVGKGSGVQPVAQLDVSRVGLVDRPGAALRKGGDAGAPDGRFQELASLEKHSTTVRQARARRKVR